MSDRAFIDTNIFIYFQRADDPGKKQIADDTLDTFECLVSTQVLNEICNLLTKKYPIPLPDLQLFIQDIKDSYELVIISDTMVSEALEIHGRYQISYFDALMVVAALKTNCKYLVTEDMQDGLVIDGRLTILNIFNHVDMLNPDGL
jgi:predicted nucleic acid-binding protein